MEANHAEIRRFYNFSMIRDHQTHSVDRKAITLTSVLWQSLKNLISRDYVVSTVQTYLIIIKCYH